MSMTPTDGTSPLRNSWPDSGIEEAPPLPPRSHSKGANMLKLHGGRDGGSGRDSYNCFMIKKANFPDTSVT